MASLKVRLMGSTVFSTMEWPGRPAALVRLQGCDIRCPWCHGVGGVEIKGGRFPA